MSASPEIGLGSLRAFAVTRSMTVAALLAFSTFPALSLAQSSCPGIHVKILDIRNSTGSVACALFDAPEGFPKEFLRHASRIQMTKIIQAEGRCDFQNIEPGTYALAVVHDENMDGKIGTNWLGVPTEGYGFSAGAEVSMSAPSFEDASFTYDGKQLELKIRLTY
ncbi:DUF2141 domain-containing protein [Wenzhouxiangella sp. EGI_FJ10409]|uniref:DUF2141 domain-containing protein n=1 Tax=Wenzhouxiangella sp. EGI_FJ10409 TaxID=3243767 RepID=UPI0035D7CDC6